jgi:formylglycine-generating enzyme
MARSGGSCPRVVRREGSTGAWTREFVMDATHAEPRGYLAGTQSPDNMIHIPSSRLHDQFNLAWLQQSPSGE